MRRIEMRNRFRGKQGLAALAATVAGVVLVLLLPSATDLMLGATLVIVISLLMMHRSSGLFNLRAPTIPTLCYLVYLVMVVVPAFFVYKDQVEPYINVCNHGSVWCVRRQLFAWLRAGGNCTVLQKADG